MKKVLKTWGPGLLHLIGAFSPSQYHSVVGAFIKQNEICLLHLLNYVKLTQHKIVIPMHNV